VLNHSENDDETATVEAGFLFRMKMLEKLNSCLPQEMRLALKDGQVGRAEQDGCCSDDAGAIDHQGSKG
jgi:hypothetical protein